MDMTMHWLEAQKATPSFTTQYDDVTNILDAPLPAGLRTTSSAAAAAYLRQDHSASYALSPGASSRGVGRAAGTFGGSPSPNASARYNYGGGASLTPSRWGERKHEELLYKGELARQRREALQEKMRNEEKRKMRVKPKISEDAQKLHRDGPIEKRLLRRAEEKSKRMEYDRQTRDQQEEKVMAGFTFKPRISSRGKRATSKNTLTKQHDQWSRRKEEKVASLRTETVIKEMAEVRDRPDINPLSAKLAEKRRDREGMAGLDHVEAMLERDRLSKLARWERFQQEQATQVSNPHITMYAATLPRDGDVGDRLYAESFRAEERKAARLQEKLDATQHNATTVRSSSFNNFSAAAPPAASSGATPRSHNTPRSGRPVEDELMMRHLDALAAREDKLRQELSKETLSHNPAINPVSDAIAARLPQSSKERLYRPRTPSAAQHGDPNSNTGVRSHYNPPQRSVGRSTQRSASNASSSADEQQREADDFHRREVARLEQLKKHEEKRQEKLLKLQGEREKREMEGCTFTPRTNRSFSGATTAATATATTTSSSGAAGASKSDAGDSVYERNAQWMRKREVNLEEQRLQKHEQEVTGCTFAPLTSSASTDPAPSIYGGDGDPWGTQEYLERQAEARRRREEGQAKLMHTPTQWRNRVTVPKEFNLGKRDADSKPLRALQRPFEYGIPRLGDEEEEEENERHQQQQHGGGFSSTAVPPAHHFSSSHASHHQDQYDQYPQQQQQQYQTQQYQQQPLVPPTFASAAAFGANTAMQHDEPVYQLASSGDERY